MRAWRDRDRSAVVATPDNDPPARGDAVPAAVPIRYAARRQSRKAVRGRARAAWHPRADPKAPHRRNVRRCHRATPARGDRTDPELAPPQWLHGETL